MDNYREEKTKFSKLASLARRAGRGRAAITAAQYEAVTFTNALTNPNLSEGSPPWRRLTAKKAVLDLLRRAAKSKRNWFRVGRTPYGHQFQPTQEGKELLHWLNELGPYVWTGFYRKRVHPHLALLFEVAAHLLVQYRGLIMSGHHLAHALDGDPVPSEVLMNELVRRLRIGLNEPIITKKALQHEQQDLVAQIEMQMHFAEIAKDYPNAIVFRCELRQSQQTMQFGNYVPPEQARGQSVAWVEGMKAAHGDAVVGLAFRMAYDDEHGWSDHILLIMNGPAASAHYEIMSAAKQRWLQIAGPGANFVNCKGHHVNLSYRGRCLSPAGDSLAEELIDATFFLTRVDGLVSDDLHGYLTLSGCKRLPMPKTPSTWRRAI